MLLYLYSSCVSEFPILKKNISHKKSSQMYEATNFCGNKKKKIFNLEEVLINKIDSQNELSLLSFVK